MLEMEALNGKGRWRSKLRNTNSNPFRLWTPSWVTCLWCCQSSARWRSGGSVSQGRRTAGHKSSENFPTLKSTGLSTALVAVLLGLQALFLIWNTFPNSERVKRDQEQSVLIHHEQIVLCNFVCLLWWCAWLCRWREGLFKMYLAFTKSFDMRGPTAFFFGSWGAMVWSGLKMSGVLSSGCQWLNICLAAGNAWIRSGISTGADVILYLLQRPSDVTDCIWYVFAENVEWVVVSNLLNDRASDWRTWEHWESG